MSKFATHLSISNMPWQQRCGIIVAFFPFYWRLQFQRLGDARVLTVGPVTLSLHVPNVKALGRAP